MLITDAVCLKLIDEENLLLAVGNSLHHYHQPAIASDASDAASESAQLRTVLADVLPEHIHGIVSCSVASADERTAQHHIVAFGGPYCVQLRLVDNRLSVVGQRTQLSDWLSSAHLFGPVEDAATTDESAPTFSNSTLLVLTNRGSAVWLRLSWPRLPSLDQPLPAPHIKRTQRGPENSTLYCSRIVVTEADSEDATTTTTTFLGGTAFGELIVWRCHAAAVQLLQRLDCHNGCCFSIDAAPAERLLTTTSDDRSVRVWQLGDQDDLDTTPDRCWSRIRLLRTLFAHTARVFRSRLIGGARLLSAGEDGQLCVWDARGGQLLRRHQLTTTGAGLWHLDFAERSQQALVAAADGNCWQVCVAAGAEAVLELRRSSARLAELLEAGEPVVKAKFFGSGAENEEQRLVCVTARNRLAVGGASTTAGDPNDGGDWHISDVSVPFAISVLETCGNRIAVAGYQRLLVFVWSPAEQQLRLSASCDTAAADMVQTVRFVVGDGGGNDDDVEIVVGDAFGEAQLFALPASSAAGEVQQLDGAGRRFQMRACREPWATVCLRIDARLLAIGDRCGNLLLYQQSDEVLSLCDVIRRVHAGRMGACTALSRSGADGSIISAGHDGSVRRIGVDVAGRRWLGVWHEQPVPMSWVHTVQLNGGGGLRTAVGFESTRCVVWRDEQAAVGGEQLAVIECGGGQRCVDVTLDASGAGGYFACVQRNRLRVWRFSAAAPESGAFRMPAQFHRRWHTLSCTCVQAVPLRAGLRLIASGGDDNRLKIHTLHAAASKQSHLHFHADICTHRSSVKALVVVPLPSAAADPPSSSGRWRLVSVGGRAQMCVTDLDIVVDGDGDANPPTVTCRARAHSQLNADDATTDARLMAVAAVSERWFVVGCSTGRVQLVRFDEPADGRLAAGGRLTVVSSSAYGCCVLRVMLIGSAVVCTAATDGWLSFWELCGADELQQGSTLRLAAQPFHRVRHHRSGVQSMDWRRVADGAQNGEGGAIRIDVVTGGDDQRVVCSRLTLHAAERRIDRVRTAVLPQVHSAQVNAVRFAGRALFTSGVDQTVWRWPVPGGDDVDEDCWSSVTVARLGQLWARTAVADTKGVECWTDGRFAGDGDDDEIEKRVLVYGYGVQLLQRSSLK